MQQPETSVQAVRTRRAAIYLPAASVTFLLSVRLERRSYSSRPDDIRLTYEGLQPLHRCFVKVLLLTIIMAPAYMARKEKVAGDQEKGGGYWRCTGWPFLKVDSTSQSRISGPRTPIAGKRVHLSHRCPGYTPFSRKKRVTPRQGDRGHGPPLASMSLTPVISWQGESSRGYHTQFEFEMSYMPRAIRRKSDAEWASTT
jgi:hypothetical protein